MLETRMRRIIPVVIVGFVALPLVNVVFGQGTVAYLLSQALPAYLGTEGGKRMLGFLALILLGFGVAVYLGGYITGWACRVAGVALLAVAGFGGWNHQIWWLLALGIGYGGIILFSTGTRLIANAPPPAPAPALPVVQQAPPLPFHAVSTDTYGKAGWAHPKEIGHAWGGNNEDRSPERMFED